MPVKSKGESWLSLNVKRNAKNAAIDAAEKAKAKAKKKAALPKKSATKVSGVSRPKGMY